MPSKWLAEIGYGVAVQSLAIEPFANIAWVNLHTGDLRETGASAGLTGSSTSSSVGYSSLGVRAATSMALGDMVLRPHASLAWQLAFGDTSPNADLAFISAPSAGFTVSGVPIAENTARSSNSAPTCSSARKRASGYPIWANSPATPARTPSRRT
jgi:outer membrane autotransporter protein